MSFVTELKRRKVFRVAATYLIVSWVIIQVGSITFPTLNLPSWALPLITVLVIAGFPFAMILAWAYDITPEGIQPAAAQSAQTVVQASDPKLMYILIALVLVLAGFQITDRFSSNADSGNNPDTALPVSAANTQAQTQRTSLVLPPDVPMVFGWSPGRSLAISPDGRTVVYVGRDVINNAVTRSLIVRSLDSLQTKRLPGTENARQPFFSPDGQWVGFFTSDGALKKVALNGGTAVTILDDINGSIWTFAAWQDNNQIVFTDNSGGQRGLHSISANGGQVSLLTTPNPVSGELNHYLPEAIPDSDVVLFTSFTSVENQLQPNIEALITSTGERKLILQDAAGGRYLESGHLLFNTVDLENFIVPFDAEQLMITGSAVAMLDEVRHDGFSGEGPVSQLDVSSNGTLAFAPPIDTRRQLYLVARDGTADPLPVVPDSYEVISVTPDGQSAAFEIKRGLQSEVRLYDFARQSSTLLAQEDGDFNSSPVWHPDGRALIVNSATSGETGLWLKIPNGASRLLVATEPGGPAFRNVSWHPDGRRLAVTRQTGSEHDILLLTLNGDDEPVTQEPLLVGSTSDYSPTFSPDGRWLAYVSDKSGQYQVYIRSFPTGSEYIASVGTSAGGPLWSADGSELFFTQSTADEEFMMTAVSVTNLGDTLQLGRPSPLFPMTQRDRTGSLETYAGSYNSGARYTLMPDGRFLMSRAPASSQYEIVLVQNWFEELKTLAPIQ